MKKDRPIVAWIFIIIFIVIAFKMCSVTSENTGTREPLRQIDNWK